MSLLEARIAVLLPTRHRPTLATQSLQSLADTADRPDKLHIMLGIDTDDLANGKQIAAFCEQARLWTTSCHFDRLGYARLHDYNNTLAAHSTADWFMIWNDDCLMETQGWDTFIRVELPRHVGDLHCSNFPAAFQWGTLPVIPRWWFDTLGVLSRSPHCDTYIISVADCLQRRLPLPISVQHNRQDDALAAEITADGATYNTGKAFYTKEVVRWINADAKTLARCNRLVVYRRVELAKDELDAATP